jgi:hypothetical protein
MPPSAPRFSSPTFTASHSPSSLVSQAADRCLSAFHETLLISGRTRVHCSRSERGVAVREVTEGRSPLRVAYKPLLRRVSIHCSLPSAAPPLLTFHSVRGPNPCVPGSLNGHSLSWSIPRSLPKSHQAMLISFSSEFPSSVARFSHRAIIFNHAMAWQLPRVRGQRWLAILTSTLVVQIDR